jgi:hypothetical protein
LPQSWIQRENCDSKDAHLRRPHAPNTLSARSPDGRFSGPCGLRAVRRQHVRNILRGWKRSPTAMCALLSVLRGLIRAGATRSRAGSEPYERAHLASHGIRVAWSAAMTPIASRDDSPFNCHWVVRGSEFTLNDRSYAICAPVLHTKRLVCESYCATCRRWEGSDDLAEWSDVKAPRFNCRWIVGGSAFCLDDINYATCARVCRTEHLVSTCDCAGCPDWGGTSLANGGPRAEQPNQRRVGDTPDEPAYPPRSCAFPTT